MTIIEIEAAIIGHSENKLDILQFWQKQSWEQTRRLTYDISAPHYKKMDWFKKAWLFPWDKKLKKTGDIKRKLKKADKIFPKTIKKFR